MSSFFKQNYIFDSMSDTRHRPHEHAEIHKHTEIQVPHAGERVRLKDRAQTGVVLCVHHEARTVDVLLMGGMRKVLNGLPLDRVSILREEAELSEADSA